MNRFFILVTACFAFLQATAQAPQKFNYQGLARNAQGEAMANQSMALKIGLLSAADSEVPDYEEIHQVKTNEFGLYTLEIGAGEAVTGTMASVRWETGNKYVRVAIDPQGGNNFDVVGTNQLLSVPYALYSDKAGMARKISNTIRGGQANYISKFDSTGSSSSEIQSVLYDNGNNVGIGTTTPLAKIHIQASANSLPGVRIQNINPVGFGRFLFYNDSTNSYGTMTKYGTTFPGQPFGLAGLYPYANLWTFGNNAIIPNDGSGRTLISSAGNVGICYVKNGAFKLKFHADYNSGNVGIGGNTIPRAKIHLNNTDSTYINLMLSTNTTGHTPTDGLNIAVENKDASIINRENGSLIMGTLNTERMRVTVNGNVGIGTTTPSTKLDVNGQIKIKGGNPAPGLLLTAVDTNGTAVWTAGQPGPQGPEGPAGSFMGSFVSASLATNASISNSNTVLPLTLTFTASNTTAFVFFTASANYAQNITSQMGNVKFRIKNGNTIIGRATGVCQEGLWAAFSASYSGVLNNLVIGNSYTLTVEANSTGNPQPNVVPANGDHITLTVVK